MARAHVTTDHRKIRQWAEHRGGHPITVKRSGSGGAAGVLRLDFDSPGAVLEVVTWEEFFEKFDDADLAFLYQEQTSAGEESRFHKFVSRDTAEAVGLKEDEGDDDEQEDGDEDAQE